MATQVMTPLSAPGNLPEVQEDWPEQGMWRYEDYLRLPNDGKRYEIIEGILHVANAPSYEHQYTVSEILFNLKLFVNQNKLGIVLTAPFEVHLSDTSRPVQPDVLFIEAEQQPTSGSQVFEGVPSLIVEVISPSSWRRDQKIKFDAYEKAGVTEYWIANPNTRSVQVHTLSAGEYALLGEFKEDEAIQSKVLEGLSIITSQLFTP